LDEASRVAKTCLVWGAPLGNSGAFVRAKGTEGMLQSATFYSSQALLWDWSSPWSGSPFWHLNLLNCLHRSFEIKGAAASAALFV
jgi:hypothetical protein